MSSKATKVYIVDDDPVYVFTLQKLISLKQFCDNVFIFQNGYEAITSLKAEAFSNELLPDIILLDINMPIMDGWQFMDAYVELLPKLDKQITIYMVSSSIEEEDNQRAKSYKEIKNYIVKPITPSHLAEIFGVPVMPQA